MGRPRKPENRDLPAGVYRKRGRTYDSSGRVIAATSSSKMPDLLRRVFEFKQRTISRGTAALYQSCVRKLAPMLADFEPRQVRGRDIADVKLALIDTPNMANACVSFLRITFDFALEHQLVDTHPCAGIKRLPEKKRRRLPTDVELRAVHDHASPQLRVIIKLLVLTGQRVGDVLRIKRSDILDAGNAIRFVQQKTGAPMTVRNPELRDVIAEADALHGNVRALTLLHNRRGRAPCYRQVFDEWHAACSAAGVSDLHMHDLRAKAITAAKLQGLDPRALAGHASETMTARYIRHHDEPQVAGPSFGRVLNSPK